MLKRNKLHGFQGSIFKGKFPLGWGLQVCDFRDWLLVKVTEWCSRSLVLSLKLLFFTWMRVLVPMCVRAKSLQACLTLCDPMDCSLASSSAHEILQARILEWVTMPSSWGSFQPRDQICVSYASCIGRWVLYCQRHLGSWILVPPEELKDLSLCIPLEEELELWFSACCTIVSWLLFLCLCTPFHP